MLRFWSTTTGAASPARSGSRSIASGPLSGSALKTTPPAASGAQALCVPALADVDPRVGRRPVLLRCAHGVSSPLSRPEAAEATPALPGRGVARPARLYQPFPRRRTRPGGNTPRGPRRSVGAGADGHPGRSVGDRRNGPIVSPHLVYGYGVKGKGRPRGRLKL